MIVTLMLYLVGIFTRLLAVLLPQWEIPSSAVTAWDSFMAYTGLLDTFFPLSDLFTMILVIVVYKLSLLAFRTGVGVISLMRGGGNINI